MACARPACGQVFFLCLRCDRGHRYCGAACAAEARRTSLLAAGRRYQSTLDGRLAHAERQRRYRERRSAKVTHHRRDALAIAAKVRAPPTTSATEALPAIGVEVATDALRTRSPCCAACGRAGRFVRHETLARAGRLHRQRRFRSRGPP